MNINSKPTCPMFCSARASNRRKMSTASHSHESEELVHSGRASKAESNMSINEHNSIAFDRPDAIRTAGGCFAIVYTKSCCE
mmetsp:Transcript_5100/g.9384  ORF Transcript_5100/g.9384 Transcript_5100/m.9384 type:complete len:82 (+) Transcript_5100:536-781(+)